MLLNLLVSGSHVAASFQLPKLVVAGSSPLASTFTENRQKCQRLTSSGLASSR